MINERYSFKDFSNQKFLAVNVTEFNNSTIKGSNFYQENRPRSSIFPVGTIGVIFERCNLDNVLIPPGNIVFSSINRMIQVQQDKEDWVVDNIGRPIEPVEKERFLEEGISTDPDDIRPPEEI